MLAEGCTILILAREPSDADDLDAGARLHVDRLASGDVSPDSPVNK
jgi:hypothetical protein